MSGLLWLAVFLSTPHPDVKDGLVAIEINHTTISKFDASAKNLGTIAKYVSNTYL